MVGRPMPPRTRKKCSSVSEKMFVRIGILHWERKVRTDKKAEGGGKRKNRTDNRVNCCVTRLWLEIVQWFPRRRRHTPESLPTQGKSGRKKESEQRACRMQTERNLFLLKILVVVCRLGSSSVLCIHRLRGIFFSRKKIPGKRVPLLISGGALNLAGLGLGSSSSRWISEVSVSFVDVGFLSCSLGHEGWSSAEPGYLIVRERPSMPYGERQLLVCPSVSLVHWNLLDKKVKEGSRCGGLWNMTQYFPSNWAINWPSSILVYLSCCISPVGDFRWSRDRLCCSLFGFEFWQRNFLY